MDVKLGWILVKWNALKCFLKVNPHFTAFISKLGHLYLGSPQILFLNDLYIQGRIKSAEIWSHCCIFLILQVSSLFVVCMWIQAHRPHPLPLAHSRVCVRALDVRYAQLSISNGRSNLSYNSSDVWLLAYGSNILISDRGYSFMKCAVLLISYRVNLLHGLSRSVSVLACSRICLKVAKPQAVLKRVRLCHQWEWMKVHDRC